MEQLLMKQPTKQIEGVLCLEDGRRFYGMLFGSIISKDALYSTTARDRGYGEVVFNTSMTGYQEILTDPSYYGQIVTLTAAHVGNTGINAEDAESASPRCAGLIIHEMSFFSSNWRAEEELDAYLKKNGIPGIYGIDTRALTRHLRTRGVVRGMILPTSEENAAEILLNKLPSFEGRDLLKEVTTKKPYTWKTKSNKAAYKVVALDYGIKWNLLRSLEELGCEIEVLPADATADDILSRKPDGVFLSNGPGDPAEAPYAVKTVREILGKTPVFGVCMGHQILALALGGTTYKLKFGHRGGNQPVLSKRSGQVEISSHNHGYAVAADSLPKNVVISHINLNDRTVEGLAAPDLNAFSVQYHPEACPGPHDSVSLFKQFIDLMKDQACTKNTSSPS